MGKANELKNELRRLIMTIITSEKVTSEIVGKVFETIFALKAELDKCVEKVALAKPVAFPNEFLCPLSQDVMSEPVIISSGQTYDKTCIENWIASGKKTCPRTNKALTDFTVTPNHLVSKLISDWCRTHGLPIPIPKSTKSDKTLFISLHMKLSVASPTEQKEAAKELRRLTREKSDFRQLYAEAPEFITQLFNAFPQPEIDPEIDPEFHEDLITIVLNLSIHEKNKKAVADCPMTIPALIQGLEAQKLEIRCNTAAAIYHISSLDSSKELIGKSGAFKLLIDLLKEKGSPQATKDATKAICSLCLHVPNKGRAVRLGIVSVLVEKIAAKTFVDEILRIIFFLSLHKQAQEELESLEFAPALLSIVRENPFNHNQVMALRILRNVLGNDCPIWKETIRKEEEELGTITKFYQNGTPMAQKKAYEILESLNKETVIPAATSSTVSPS